MILSFHLKMHYFRGIYYFFGLALTADITAVGRFQWNVLQNVSLQKNKQNAVYLSNFKKEEKECKLYQLHLKKTISCV